MVPKLPPSDILSVGGGVHFPPTQLHSSVFNLIFLMFGILVQLT